MSAPALNPDLLAALRAHVRRLTQVDPRQADGALVRATRVMRGWSQRELAAALGVHANTVARWERGELTMSRRSRHQVLQLRD